ncbi:hypothetical protein [Microbacterium saperdae]|nr:hypothetical protein [Microbacterium saperdae]
MSTGRHPVPQRDIDPADLFLPPTEPIDITWMQAALAGTLPEDVDFPR